MATIHRTLAAVLVGALVLVLSACGGSTPSSASPTTAAQGRPAENNQEPSASSEEEPEGEAPENQEPGEAPTDEGETIDITDIGGSLAGLQSYRLRFTYSFEGKDAQGQQQQGSIETLEEFIRGSSDHHLRWSSTGTWGGAAQDGVFETFTVDGVSYLYTPAGEQGEQCLSFSSEDTPPASGAVFEPEDIIGGLQNAELVSRGETVNGVEADHYRFDESDVTFAAFSAARGDVWIAQEGGYLVRYVGEATGSGVLWDGEGTLRWEYNVEEANKIEAIELPAVCEAQKPADDIPFPENAQDKANFGGTITFSSPDSPSTIAEFYKEQLPAQGWTAGEAQSFAGTESLTFTKENRSLSILISTDSSSSGSSVLITETRDQ